MHTRYARSSRSDLTSACLHCYEAGKSSGLPSAQSASVIWRTWERGTFTELRQPRAKKQQQKQVSNILPILPVPPALHASASEMSVITATLFIITLIHATAGDPDRDNWITAVSRFEQLAYPLKHAFTQRLDLISADAAIRMSTECRQSLSNFSTGLINDDFEAMLLFDSFSKVWPGQLTFQGYNYGAYYQCLDHGRYVYLGIDFPVPQDTSVKKFVLPAGVKSDWKINWSRTIGIRRLQPFQFAICSPDACSEADLRAIFDSESLKQDIPPLSVRIITTESRSDPHNKTWTQIAAMTTLLSIILLGIFSSAMNNKLPEHPLSQKLKPFDALSNTVQLFSPVAHPDSMFTSINLARTIYFMVSVLTHQLIGVNIASQFPRLEAGITLVNSFNWPLSSIVSAFYAASASIMSTNVVLASCFAIVKWIPIMMNKKVTFVTFAMERVFRTLPVVAAYLILVQTLPIVKHGGPLMKRAQERYADICYRNGWRELLFINNYLDVREICLPVAWFMSAEFQLYIMSFVVILLIAKYPQHGVKIITGMLITGWIVTGAVYSVQKVPPFMTFKHVDAYFDMNNYSTIIYFAPNFIPAYAIGMLLGLKLLQGRGKPKPVGYGRFLIILIALCGSISITGLLHDDRKFIFGPLAELLFICFTRSTIAVAMAFMYYANLNATNTFVLTLARSRFAAIVSRLSLSWFLMHVMSIVLTASSCENSHLSVTLTIMEFFFILITSFVPTCMMYVFVEAPFSRILSNITKSRIAREKQLADAVTNDAVEEKKSK